MAGTQLISFYLPDPSPRKKPSDGFECQICFAISDTQADYVTHILQAHSAPATKPDPKTDLDRLIEVETIHEEVTEEDTEEPDDVAVVEVVCPSSTIEHEEIADTEENLIEEEHEVAVEEVEDGTAEAEPEEIEFVESDGNSGSGGKYQGRENQCPDCKKTYATASHYL